MFDSFLFYTLLAIAMAASVEAYVPVAKNMRSFSSAIKDGKMVAKKEKLLYEHDTGQPGVITEQWFTGIASVPYAFSNWPYIFHVPGLHAVPPPSLPRPSSTSPPLSHLTLARLPIFLLP